ncbi:MAG: GDP-mannose 4,6-dehydratase [Planctomycetes bacterium]|nr:GDP-mannose 4,6-dehydratase [Planctomycetota bacterium]
MAPPSETFVVLGSNSFSGATFVAEALADGARVIGISRSAEPDEALLPYRWAPHERFTFHALDFNRDLDGIGAVIDAARPDYVVNFAAQSMVAQSWDHPEHWYQTNVVATARLVDRLKKAEFLKKFVQISTPEVYGSTSGLVKETAPFNPSTPYAVSKAACDMNLQAYRKAYGFPVAFTRAANVCGPGQPLYRIIPRTVFCILTGRRLKLEGGGTSVRSFIHMADVARGTLAVARRGIAGDVYHLATGTNQTIREVVEEICRQLGARFDDAVESTPPRLAQDPAYLLDCTKARGEFGWEPKRSVADVIAETISWLKKNLDRLQRVPADYVHKP